MAPLCEPVCNSSQPNKQFCSLSYETAYSHGQGLECLVLPASPVNDYYAHCQGAPLPTPTWADPGQFIVTQFTLSVFSFWWPLDPGLFYLRSLGQTVIIIFISGNLINSVIFLLSRFASSLLVVSFNLLAAECCRDHLHSCSTWTLYCRCDHCLLYHNTTVLVVPFNGQWKGESSEDVWIISLLWMQWTLFMSWGFR